MAETASHMISAHGSRWFPSVVLLTAAALGILGGCKNEPPSRWDDAAAAAASHAAAAADPATPKPEVAAGGALNAYFPKTLDGAKLTYAAEKTGYAEAKLHKDDKELGVLSISDTNNNADAKAKFAGASDTSLGYPLVTTGKNQSSVLVKDRWQVKVSSMSLDEAARKSWLQKFDLAGLAKL